MTFYNGETPSNFNTMSLSDIASNVNQSYQTMVANEAQTPERGTLSRDFLKDTTIETQPLSAPLPSYPPQPMYAPQSFAPPSTQMMPQNSYEIEEEDSSQDQSLLEAHEITKEARRREVFFKENYLKAEQKAASREKEILSKDLELAKYFHTEALRTGNIPLQSEMNSKQHEIQKDMLQLENDHQKFLENYRDIIDDELPIVEYTPRVDENETLHNESQNRQHFRQSNSWYDVKSPHYNDKLAAQAHDIEENMLAEYQLKGLTNYFDSPYYFDDLKNRVLQKFNVDAGAYPMTNNNVYPPQPPQMMPGQQPHTHFMPQAPQMMSQNPYQQQMMQQGQPNPYGMSPQTPAFYPAQQQQMAPQYPSPYPQQQMAYGPPTAAVNYGTSHNVQNVGFNQKAYDIFESSISSDERYKQMSPEMKMRFFQEVSK